MTGANLPIKPSMMRSVTVGIRIAATLGLMLVAAIMGGALWRWSVSRHNAIQELREATVGARVHLLGVVTYADAPQNRFWIQDESGAVAIGVNPEKAGVHVGETVTVVATKTARYDPLQGPNSVGLKDFRISAARAQMKLPPPFAISVDDFPTPERNGVRVQVTAVVRSAERDGAGRGSMTIAGSGFEAGMIVAKPGDLSRLVDAEVRVTGIPEEKRDSEGWVDAEELWVPSEDNVEIVTAPPERSPLYTLRTLYAADPNQLVHRIRLRGRVAAALRGSLLIDDRWGAIACEVSDPHALQPGAAVEVAGFPSRDGLRIDLSHCVASAIAADEIDAADRGKRAPPILSTIKPIRDLAPAQAALALPVRVQGVITFVDSAWGQLYLQDQTAGIYVKYASDQEIAVGDRVTLVGLSGAGDFAPVIVAPRLQREGAAPLPGALPVTAAAAAAGVLDSQYVSVEGLVRPIKFADDPNHPIATFDLQTDLGQVHVSTAPYLFDRQQPQRLNDARVRIRGVFGTIYNSRRQILGYQLLVASPSEIEILEPATPDPFSMDATPVGSVLRFSPTRDWVTE